MYVCLCEGVTSHTIAECIERGARSSREVADRCAAGTVCGRCRATVRAMIEAHFRDLPPDLP